MAGRYATALFELALEERALDAVKADLDRFDGLIAESPDLRRLVRSPAFTAEAQSRALAAVLDQLCGGRLVLSHEGGYSAMYVPYCGLAVMEELSGIRTHIQDPWAPLLANYGQQALQPHQDKAIAAAAELIANIA